jgi:hypothetical protein
VLPAALLAACSSLPGLDDPSARISPLLTFGKVGGEVGMQSATGSGGSVVDNPQMPVEEFGLDDSDSGYGLGLAFGDGFSGLEASYQELDNETTVNGTLSQDFGALRAGDTVNTESTFYELRASYVGEVLGFEPFTNWRFRAGLGAQLAHKELEFRVREVTGLRQQNLELRDHGVGYLGARVGLGWRQFLLHADWWISPDWNLGGEFDGTLQDVEVRASWTFEDHDATLFAGWRGSWLPAEDDVGGLRFDADFEISQLFVGGSFKF